MSAVLPLYVKTAYHDEPSFANAKVVTSLFTSQLKGELGAQFKQNVVFKSATEDKLAVYDDKFDFMELGKLALDYSDAVVEASSDVNSDLLAYAKGKGMPVLNYPGEDFGSAYSKFYNEIISE